MYNISFKAYNTKKLKHLHRNISTSAWVWNHCIALNKRYYKIYGKYINVNNLQKHIAKLRNKNEQWKELNSQSVQEICQRVDLAYKRFFKGLAERPPKFKKARNFNSFVLKQSGWKIEENVLIIQKRRYKFSKSREYENIKRITVKRNKLGEIFFVVCCDVKPMKYERVGDSAIGMDFGLKTYLTLSNGQEVVSPQFFKQHLKDIKRANKTLSKKKKGSKNRKKALKTLQRVHNDIANKRSDFHWKLAHELCKNNFFIVIEDLNIDAMKKLWGRKISDLAFSEFVNKLKQVAVKYGTIVHEIDRWYPSSKTCTCGVVNKKLKLSEREWACSSCGEIHNRDLLAANNILRQGIVEYKSKCKSGDSSAICVDGEESHLF